MKTIRVTEETSQAMIFSLYVVAFRNMESISVTFETSQDFKLPSKLTASPNMFLMLVT
jgi:hypothetical protein